MPLDLLTRLDPLRRVRCPFCFEQFAAFEMHLRCEDPYCKTDYVSMIDDPIRFYGIHGRRASWKPGAYKTSWWIDPSTDPRRGLRRHFDWLVMPRSLDCPNCERPTDVHLCPHCHARIPDCVVTVRAGHVAIFGPQSIGKTTYVTVLIHELNHKVGPEHGFVLTPLTEDVQERYITEYQSITYGQASFTDDEQAPQRGSHSGTAPIEQNRRSLLPLAYRMTTRTGRGGLIETLISIFDTAGEDWEKNFDLFRTEARFMSEAGGLLFSMDPLSIPEIRRDQRITLTPKEREVLDADFLGDIVKLQTVFPRTPVRTPIAIVLNKLDRWGRLLAKGTALHEWATSVPTTAADRQLDQAIHKEVRATLANWGQLGFLAHLDTHFPNHRFFACSSLGDAAQADEHAPQPLPTPLLIERPVLWLLERQGLLKPV